MSSSRISLWTLWVLSSLLFALGCQSPVVGAECRAGLELCDGVCVDVLQDPANCGGCGIMCSDDQACRLGLCRGAGDGGSFDTEGGVADGGTLDGSPGGSLDGSTDYDAGVGLPGDAGEPADGGMAMGCDVGEQRCDGECVRPSSDPRHCGGCGIMCADGHVCAAGACQTGCTSPLGICDGLCVDLRSHPDHCGGCGISCPSGVCSGSMCLGPQAGHVVVVGHSYVRSRRLMNRVAGNSVFLTRTNPARVVVYEGDALLESVTGTDAAISQVATATGRTWMRSAARADEVPLQLASADVLVVYAQTNASDGTIADLGEQWALALSTFLGTGGVVVVFDGVGRNRGTHVLLEATGLMSTTGVTDVTGTVLDVVSPGDAVALGVPLRYRGETSTVRLGTRDGTTVVSDGAGAVVSHAVVLP